MKKKKKGRLFWVTLTILFIVYMGLYIANSAGYYESKLSDKVKLTSESITKFENDVAQGKDVTIDDYLEKEHIDYSNKASKLGLKISEGSEKFMTKGLSKFLKVIGKLFS